MSFDNRQLGALFGSWIGDALAMPVHWYYDRQALQRDYGEVRNFIQPKSIHPDSILWRSHWDAPSAELDILGAERELWGQRGVHYHRNLVAGENTLTIKLAGEAWQSLLHHGGCNHGDFLRRYIGLLVHPSRHRDTYLEECHRAFFTHLGRGLAPENCAVTEKHIGGLAMMMPVPIYYSDNEGQGLSQTLQHLALTHAGDKMRIAAEAILSLLFPALNGVPLKEAIQRECEVQRNPHFGFPFFKWLKRDLSDQQVIGRQLSTACYVESAVPAVIYLALKYADRPEEGLIANTNLGGDNVHRGAVLGALLGAANGMAAWPSPWTEGLVDPPATQVEKHGDTVSC